MTPLGVQAREAVLYLRAFGSMNIGGFIDCESGPAEERGKPSLIVGAFGGGAQSRYRPGEAERSARDL